MNSFKHFIKKTDILLIFICFSLSTISILSLYIISNSFFSNKKIVIVQTVASIIGLVIASLISNVDYHLISKLFKVYVPISIFFVILTFFIGAQRGGADDKAWIMLPFGISIQPSEFLKIAFILSFSTHLNFVRNKIDKLLNVILLCLHGALPILLTHFQGDDGTALIFAMIFIIMIFSSGISWKYIISAIILTVISIPLLWYLMNQDQKNRILITLHPENDPTGSGYQQFYGLISIGNGNILGKGLFNSDYKFVPEIKNDFIFSFICQVFGFIGSVLILAILTTLLLRILIIGIRSSDYLGRFICIGVFGMIFSQLILNIGMNLSVLPVIGVTLPLISSGGSSVISIYAGIGLVLSVVAHNNRSLFYKYKI